MIKGTDEGVSHRGSEDPKWQETKRLCKERDKNMCVLCRMLTPGEYMLFMRSQPFMTNIIEVAHIESVGNHVEKTYDLNNVVCLCHAMHDRLDSMLNPITGKPIKKPEHYDWWQKIKKEVGIEDTDA